MAKLIKGENLTAEQRVMVLAAYVYRNTHENKARRPYLFAPGGAMATCRLFVSDDQWVRDHAFKFNKSGIPGRYAEPAYLAD